MAADGGPRPAPCSTSRSTSEDAALPPRLRWLVRARWLFLAALGAALPAGAALAGPGFPAWKLAGVGAAILYYNLLFELYHRWQAYQPAPDPAAARLEAPLQLGLDLVALTFLAHLTGGAESPLLPLYLWHAVAGSLLLSPRGAWRLGAAACLLVAALAGLEGLGLVGHVGPGGLAPAGRHRDPAFLAAALLSLSAAVLGAVAVTRAFLRELARREAGLAEAEARLAARARELAAVRREVAVPGPAPAASSPAPGPLIGARAAGVARALQDPTQALQANLAVLAEAFGDALPLLDAAHAARPALRLARLEYPFFRRQVPVLLQDLVEGAGRVAALARDLEAYARDDAAGPDAPVDANRAVQASLRLLQGKLRHLEVSQDLDPRLPRLRGHPGRLQQAALETLAGLAGALGPAGPGRLLVRTRPEPGAHQVRLTVAAQRPSAPGAPALPLHAEGVPGEATRAIVAEHRGRVLVEEEPGGRLAVHLILPDDAAPAAADGARAAPPAQATAPAGRTAGGNP